MGIEHHVALSSQSLRVMKQVRKYSNGDHYVFHQINNPNKPMSENTMLYAGLVEMQELEEQGVRDVRSRRFI